MLQKLKREHSLPSQRWFGEVKQLFQPPDLEYTFKLNSEVPALSEEEFRIAQGKLESPEGITFTQFCMTLAIATCF